MVPRLIGRRYHLADNDKISGTQAPTLQVADASLADEAGYYCIVSNASGTDVVSKRLYWA